MSVFEDLDLNFNENVDIYNDGYGSVSARTVLIKWLILRVLSPGGCGVWRGRQYLTGVPGDWRVPGHSRLIFRYRDMDTRERRHETIFI